MAFLFVYYSSASGSEWLTCKSFGRLEIAPTSTKNLNVKCSRCFLGAAELASLKHPRFLNIFYYLEVKFLKNIIRLLTSLHFKINYLILYHSTIGV